MEDRLTVAKILKPQGIRGEVKVQTFTDSPSDLNAFVAVYIGGERRKMLRVRPVGEDAAIVALSGVADRNAAELLRDKDVEVMRSDMPALPDGRYYIADVIGCAVISDSGAHIGEVKGITPARTDIYTLVRADGSEVVFAAADGVIEKVDIANGTVTVNEKRFREVALGN